MQRESPLVSIIIVLYNSSEYIEPCLRSLATLKYSPFEVILVDNGSNDDSCTLARKVANDAGLEYMIRRLGANGGFAKANNYGFKLSGGDIALLLNPDTEVFPDTLDKLTGAFEEDDVGVVGCKLYYPDQKIIQHAGGYVRDNGLTMHYGIGEEDAGQYEEPKDVTYVTGAALAIRRSVFERAGMLDPGYSPAYFEDVDICLNARRLGYRVAYAPEARIIHHESTTIRKFSKRYYYLYHRNRIRFMLKNFSFKFLKAKALPMEKRWLVITGTDEPISPLIRAYLTNLVMLPLTLVSRRRNDRLIGKPRIEDTVSTL
ncbi:MAG: glycosyltransferase family 2 protein [Actinobacteria bacterium]|nr:glycosyltransferase family 2 protein [Actinomycetota bacterium]MCG2818862.1 glycosyltransferase family 2 protein [Actinomycetes bacterium]MBU4178445.1 glycosyltransferase family 2 protein [Actinomycetota bacterium]MBU4219916.1 glycosyltransferase family 2 protein [Actinomycetota bacterium]MBU4359474.1 glycosyltransferase family 2 protein [Actinomycetota bacterium]